MLMQRERDRERERRRGMGRERRGRGEGGICGEGAGGDEQRRGSERKG